MFRCEALSSAAFDHVVCPHGVEFDKSFTKKSNAQGFAQMGEGGGEGVEWGGVGWRWAKDGSG